ncbi:MAG: hypothetical protein JWN44_1411 [Myxococcales bacterium]|nr:hypothetical protein [Myxococcales bacterium]
MRWARFFAMSATLAGVLVAATGCGEEPNTSPDLGVGSSDQGGQLTLTVRGQARPMAAWYSFYYEPLSDERPAGVYLVVTAVEPGFDCAHPSGAFEAISFLFPARFAGTYSANIVARRGAALGATTGSGGSAELDGDDDRLSGWDLDAGVISSSPGGSVAGRMHYVEGDVLLDGAFVAPRCAALDFIFPS